MLVTVNIFLIPASLACYQVFNYYKNIILEEHQFKELVSQISTYYIKFS